ncbi:MAG: MATE family efflux transporter [Anaerolineales bacterium]|nr:MATE family efflux transporter [Anaerolineales bacterium]
MKFLFGNKKFLNTMLKLAAPIMLQNLIFSSLNLVDGVMIGQLGESAVAAVGIANQIFFLVSLLFFGVGSGSAIFAAQYWGRKDTERIQSVLGLSLLMSISGAVLFSLVAILLPVQVISIYSKDPAVISQGSVYLQIVAFSYVVTAITNSFAFVLRSTENVKLPLLTSLVALSLNTLMNYGLVLGNFGLPSLGVKGAAIATIISRLIEVVLLLLIIYRRKLPVAAKLPALLNFKILSIKKFFNTTLPVIATEIIWSFGITTYNVVYARIGTESIAAVNIAGTLDRIIFVVFIGLGNACAIMIGNRIGAQENELATDYAKKYLLLGAIGASVLGLIMFLFVTPLLSFYQVSAATIDLTVKLISLMALSLPVRSLNLILLIGVLRAGGDTRVAFFIDAGSVWVVGVPMAFIGAYVLGLPVHWVYLMVLADEAFKLVFGLYRFFSQRWINYLVAPA